MRSVQNINDCVKETSRNVLERVNTPQKYVLLNSMHILKNGAIYVKHRTIISQEERNPQLIKKTTWK